MRKISSDGGATPSHSPRSVRDVLAVLELTCGDASARSRAEESVTSYWSFSRESGGGKGEFESLSLSIVNSFNYFYFICLPLT